MRSVYVSNFSYQLGSQQTSIEESFNRGDLFSDLTELKKAGFETHFRCADDESAYDLGRKSVLQIGDSVKASQAIIYATCLTFNGNIGLESDYARTRDIKYLIDYPASHLQADLGLEEAAVIGLNQQACTSMLGSLRLARSLLVSEPDMDQILCVTADRFPKGAIYEQTYNLISDGAASCLVSTQPQGYQIIATHALTNGAMAQANDDETVGSYFSYTHRILTELLAKAKLNFSDIDWIIPQNTNPLAWTIICQILGFDAQKVHIGTISKVGHIISSDNIVNLMDLEKNKSIKSGQKLILFMAGFGLNWQVVLLEKV